MSDKQRTREEINQLLSDYTDRHCLNCYASVCADGRVHLDDRFKLEDIKAILKIIEGDK